MVLSLFQIFTLTTLFQLRLWSLSDLHLLNNGAKLNNISKIVVLFIPFYWGHFSTAGEGVSRYLLTLGGRPRVRYFIHRRTCREDYLPYSSWYGIKTFYFLGIRSWYYALSSAQSSWANFTMREWECSFYQMPKGHPFTR